MADIFVTNDGSHSVYSDIYKEPYHSRHGAIAESKHVFIQHGLMYKMEQAEVHVFEMGFGTGLNAFLACLFAKENNCIIHYHTVEAYPIEAEASKALNYPNELGVADQQSVFDDLHLCDWNQTHQISSNFFFTKQQGALQACDLPANTFDVVFYDAFAPAAQEELWSIQIFEKLYAAIQISGLLTTYCAKGVVKRALKTAGFQIHCPAGPPGKREMTVAMK